MRNLKQYFEAYAEEKEFASQKGWFVGPDMASLICGRLEDVRPQEHIMKDPFPMMDFDDEGNLKVHFWDVDTGFSYREDLLKFRERIERKVNKGMKWLKIQAGDFIIINNEIAIHARTHFTPTYDEQDRHIMRTLCFNSQNMKEGCHDESNWVVNFTTCTQNKCVCLNCSNPEQALKLRKKPEKQFCIIQ